MIYNSEQREREGEAPSGFAGGGGDASPLKIGILLKQTPDTETRIRVLADGSGIETEGIKYIISPYDEFAIEEAIKTKEAAGPDAEVVAISLGPARVTEALRTALAMGADRAIRIDDEGLAIDSLVTARVLAAVVGAEGLDVIFAGKQAIDGDFGGVPQMVAELANMAHATVVDGFELRKDRTGAEVSRQIGSGAREIIDLRFPAVIGCEKGLNAPRYASLPGIMKAKKKPLAELKASEFLRGAGPKVVFKNFRLPPERGKGKILRDAEPAAMVKELVRLLHEEAKVI